ncbi:MAG: Do family serine endopeptidase [Sulfurimonas sp.]|jgi:serine protease Do|nr:Do family serine endopeptidase [Sulfurimonadaceae bacterium]
MKKVLLLLSLVAFTFLDAKPSVEFKSAESATNRVMPSDQNTILSYNNVLERAKTSIVNISIKKKVDQRASVNPFLDDPFFRDFFRGFNDIPRDRIEKALGSGVIVSSDGYIVTNNHVVDGANEIIVNLADDKKEYEAKLIGRDEKSDLAVIKIEAKNLNSVTFFNSDEAKVGDIVFALGNPFGVGQTITQGIVSATGRSGVGIVEYEDFIQTDASINPGNSGGALINSAGQLIGINSAILSRSGGNVGIGFAIPSNMVKTVATSLIENGKYTRAYLGVNISDVTKDMSDFYNNTYGALVTGVEDDSPASKAGLKRGDLIVEVNGKKIQSASELKNTIGSLDPNKSANIKYLRDKKVEFKTVKLTTFSGSKGSNGVVEFKGMSVVTQDSKSSRIKGVAIDKIEVDSEAYKVGLKEGDIVIQVENSEITTIDEFKKATSSSDKKRFFIYRRGAIFAVVL